MYISANRYNVYNEWFCFQQNVLTGLIINYNSIHNLELTPLPLFPSCMYFADKIIVINNSKYCSTVVLE